MPYYKLNTKPTYFRSPMDTKKKFSTLSVKNNHLTFLLLLFLTIQCFGLERTTKRVPQQVQRDSKAIQHAEKPGSEGVNPDCDEEKEFLHPFLGCVSCREYCANSTSKYCRINCPRLCKEDEFHHPLNKICVSCSQQCSIENLNNQGARGFCLNNCRVKEARCKPGEFHYERNNSSSCVPCRNVCNSVQYSSFSERRKEYCLRNCKEYLMEPLGTTTVSKLSIYTLSTNTSPKTIDALQQLLDIFRHIPWLVPVLAVIILLPSVAIAVLVGRVCKKRRRNSETATSNQNFDAESDLSSLPRPISEEDSNSDLVTASSNLIPNENQLERFSSLMTNSAEDTPRTALPQNSTSLESPRLSLV